MSWCTRGTTIPQFLTFLIFFLEVHRVAACGLATRSHAHHYTQLDAVSVVLPLPSQNSNAFGNGMYLKSERFRIFH